MTLIHNVDGNSLPQDFQDNFSSLDTRLTTVESSSSTSNNLLMLDLYDRSGVIDSSSFVPTVIPGTTTVSVSAGKGVAASKRISAGAQTISFVAGTDAAGTWYIYSTTGILEKSTTPNLGMSICSVSWSGSTITTSSDIRTILISGSDVNKLMNSPTYTGYTKQSIAEVMDDKQSRTATTINSTGGTVSITAAQMHNAYIRLAGSLASDLILQTPAICGMITISDETTRNGFSIQVRYGTAGALSQILPNRKPVFYNYYDPTGNTVSNIQLISEQIPIPPADGLVYVSDSSAPGGKIWGKPPVVASGGGANTVLYPNLNVIQAASGNNAWEIDEMGQTPVGGTENVNVISCSTNTVLSEFWLMPAPLGVTSIPAGPWGFNIYASVSSTSSNRSSTVTQNIYAVDSGAGTVTITGTGASRTATVTGGTPFLSTDASAYQANGAHYPLCGYLRTPLGIFPITGYTSSSVVTIEIPSTVSGYVNETSVSYSLWRKKLGATTPAITTIGADYQLVSATSFQTAPIALNNTTQLGTAIFATSNAVTTVNYVHGGTTRYSHITTPLSEDLGILIHNAVSQANPADADEIPIWNSVINAVSKVTWGNIKTALGTLYGSLMGNNSWTGINSFSQYLAQEYSGQLYLQTPAGGGRVRGYADILANMAGSKAVTSINTTGTTATVVCPGHGLSSVVGSSDKVTIRGANEANYNVTLTTYSYVDANTFTITVPAGTAATATGTITAYPCVAIEKMEFFNASVDVATGIWNVRDVAANCWAWGRMENGAIRYYEDATTAAGTVPTWSYSFNQVFNGSLDFAGRYINNVRLNPAAGSTAANTAPVKLTAGTNLTTPEAGAVEYDGSKVYATPSTATRHIIQTTNVATKTAADTILQTDRIILGDTITTSFTLTLPTAASAGNGMQYTIKKIAAANTLTIAGNGTETIDGVNTQVLANNNSSITVVSNGTAWYII